MKLLIIDDSRFVQQILKKALQTSLPDAEIISASSGSEGYELYQKLRPDIIITDLLMPGMTGRDLVVKIRAEDSETRIFIISADIQKVTREEMLGYGISAFINKPINEEKIDNLLTKIQEESHA